MTTKYYKFRIYVGPVHVKHYASNARAAGYTDIIPGTAHVYATAAADDLANETDQLVLRQRIADAIYGAPMAAGWRDVHILGWF